MSQRMSNHHSSWSHRYTPTGVFALIDGRCPGSRVSANRRLPGFPVAFEAVCSPLTVRGSRGFGAQKLLTAFPFDPTLEPSMVEMAQTATPKLLFAIAIKLKTAASSPRALGKLERSRI
jgi:hypothetical protein